MEAQSLLIPHYSYVRRGWILLLAVILGVPITSWVVHASFANAVGSTFFTFKLLGQITGIVGAQLFAFTLILSGRLHFLEKLFGGMDKLYVIHHRVGVIAFTFLIVHPIFLSFQFVGDSFKEMTDFLSPIGNTLPVTLGISAILMMLVLLFVTFYGAIFKYEKLKVAHRFLGAAFFFGFMHVFLIPSSLATDPILKWSILTTAALGLVVYTYRTLLGSWLVSRFDYTVSSVKNLGGDMTEINLIPVSTKMYHIPGQFGMLSFKGAPSVPEETHPFTLSSAGGDGTLRFSIKGLGDYTKSLATLTNGIAAKIEGPFGEFSYLYGKDKQIWVAGGIGVTPFVSMAEQILQADAFPYTVDFFYSARSEADGVYRELFNAVATKYPSFRFHFMPSDTKGFITGDVLKDVATNIVTRDIFICGPPGLMTALTGQLVALDVPKKNIHTERFALLK